jgi:hypothetical protein
LRQIRVGIADAYTGIVPASLSITADITVAGRPPRTELAGLLQPSGDGIYTWVLPQPLAPISKAHLFVEVADRQGNITRVVRAFSVGDN